MRRMLPAAAFLALGCQMIAGFEDFEEGDGTSDTGGSAGSGASPTGGSGGQTTQCPATWVGEATEDMVPIQRPDGTCYFMQVTEVNRSDYLDFINDNGANPGQVPPCQDNTTLIPSCEWTAPGGADAQLPVVCVDWCDAEAYCDWLGMRLCEGSYVNFADPEDSEWFNACSNGDSTAYPYSDTYSRTVCNGADLVVGTPGLSAVDAQASCATEDGVLNLSGNAAEWVDECNDAVGATDLCNVRGGSFLDTGMDLNCESKTAPARSVSYRHIGFRCCTDPS
jgi:formylglycine-generating enzyme